MPSCEKAIQHDWNGRKKEITYEDRSLYRHHSLLPILHNTVANSPTYNGCGTWDKYRKYEQIFVYYNSISSFFIDLFIYFTLCSENIPPIRDSWRDLNQDHAPDKLKKNCYPCRSQESYSYFHFRQQIEIRLCFREYVYALEQNLTSKINECYLYSAIRPVTNFK